MFKEFTLLRSCKEMEKKKKNFKDIFYLSCTHISMSKVTSEIGKIIFTMKTKIC